MNVFLLNTDHDFNLAQELPWNASDLIQDLELNTLLSAMAEGDAFLFRVAKQVLLSGLTDLKEIQYRQNILQDCLKNPAVIRAMYQIPLEALEKDRKSTRLNSSHIPLSRMPSSA